MCEARQIELAKLRKEFGDAPIEEVDGVGTPIDDGTFVAVPIYRDWKMIGVQMWRSENFYAALDKVMRATMPLFDRRKRTH